MIKKCLVVISVLGSTISIAQQVDIVQIFGQFAQASYAASKCSQPDESTRSSFRKNFEIVAARATEELMKRNPSVTEQQVAENLRNGTEAVESAIGEVIESGGCTDPRIQDLVKRFEVQANLRF